MTFRILVTGGAGYLGSVLVPELLRRGHHVTVLDNFMYRQSPLNALCRHKGFDVVRGDARSAAVLVPLLAKADIVIPLAALVGAPLCDSDPTAALTTNADAIQTIVRLMSKDQLMLIPISNSGYGIGEPGKECTEDSPMRPVSLYGTTKVQAEAHALSRENAISFRLATVFGMSPRMRIDLLVNDFVYRAVTDRAIVLFEPNFKRNYIHIHDVARAFLHGIESFETMRGHAYNVGLSSANLSKLDLCLRIKEHVPNFHFSYAPLGEDPDKRDYVVSNAKIEAAGFWPITSLDDGIRELITGYRMINNRVHGNA